MTGSSNSSTARSSMASTPSSTASHFFPSHSLPEVHCTSILQTRDSKSSSGSSSNIKDGLVVQIPHQYESFPSPSPGSTKDSPGLNPGTLHLLRASTHDSAFSSNHIGSSTSSYSHSTGTITGVPEESPGHSCCSGLGSYSSVREEGMQVLTVVLLCSGY